MLHARSWFVLLYICLLPPTCFGVLCPFHYNGVLMWAIASQITSLTIVLLNGLFRRRSKKTWKLRVTGICAGNSPGTGVCPAQMASNAENVSIWWSHHEFLLFSRVTSPCLRRWQHNHWCSYVFHYGMIFHVIFFVQHSLQSNINRVYHCESTIKWDETSEI